MTDAVFETKLAGLRPPKRGKVRDVYELDEGLLIVSTDRVSAYDFVLQPAIPDKGKVLNQLTNFWFSRLEEILPNHLIATETADFPPELSLHAAVLEGRAVWVRKAEVVPYECVARGYLAGSAFREYTATGETCGHRLEQGLLRASELEEPLFTPATKAEEGHDINIDFGTLVEGVGESLAHELRRLTLELYGRGRELARQRGLILADTKFEFGRIDDELILIDEALTPDSSRYWLLEEWQPGKEPVSYDKQPIRDWLDATGWDKSSQPPELASEVVEATRRRYIQAFERLTGSSPRL